MSDDTFEDVERQIAASRVTGSPGDLRGKVLADVQRELRAARWDRRLARMAVVLAVLGVSMNVAIGLQPHGNGAARLAHERPAESRTSLIDTAIVVGEATDARTGQQFARQRAAMTGHNLTDDEAAAIAAAVERQISHVTAGNRG